MRLSLRTRYAVYQSVLLLVVATTALALGGSMMVRRATALQKEIGEAIAAARSAEEEEALRGTAAYLSRRLFNPLVQLDVARLTGEIRQVREWLPVKSFRVADADGRVIADGSDRIESYGKLLDEPPPSVEPWRPVVERRGGEIEVRFAVRAFDGASPGFAVMTFGESPLSASLKRMDEKTDSLWASYRSSLPWLGAGILVLTVALGGLTSLRLSRSLVGPLTRMSEAARRYAAGDLDHALDLQSDGELGELAGALDQMARDLRVHERALSAEKERLAVTLRSIADGVIATDIEARVILVNRVAEQLTGWSTAEAAGRSLGDVFRTLDRHSREPLADPARAVLEKESPGGLVAPCLLLTRDGREILVADSAAPIRDPESHIVGAVLVFRDVTERERTEEQLRNTQKLEALAVLAGGIAHDFNNLLTGVFGFVDVARTEASDAGRVRQATTRALGVIERARGLTGQLLTFSKAGEPIRKPIQMGQLVRDAAGFVLSGSNVIAEFRIAPDLWPCEADEQQIGQVVDNLIINARQAMPSGGTISIELRNVESPPEGSPALPARHCVRLSVRDQGPGIPRELRQRIFEPFFTTKPVGSGLGLATAHSIVRKHGGHIEVDSESGAGATFRIYLPAAPGTQPGRRVEAPQPQPAAGPGRILVMDDEEYIRDVAQEALQSLGYEVVLARNDEEAVALVERAHRSGERVDAAILDLTIPGSAGGAAALQRLRAILPRLPAIASSGYSGDAVMARPNEHGFEVALFKPYTIAELGAAVGQVVASRGGTSPPVGGSTLLPR